MFPPKYFESLKMIENRLFILGADDPEMQAIEKLLIDCGCSVAYAIGSDGNRVHPGNAYKVNDLSYTVGEAIECQFVWVECAPNTDILRSDDSIVIDHHRPGDPGYGKPPAEFLSASSIGQVVAVLIESGVLTEYSPTLDDEGTPSESLPSGWCNRDIEIVLTCRDCLMIAAADHCLGAAYQGQCPGVNPDELMAWRVKSRASHQGRTEAEILADIRFSVSMLRMAQRMDEDIRDMRSGWIHCSECHFASAQFPNDPFVECPACGSRSFDFHFTFPELPEAACREGVAYVATITDKDGRVKDVLGGCTMTEMVAEWMAACKSQGRETYGDPVRGFAGAYYLT